ncbi:MAG: MBOAT family O-acyltransferase [Methylococcaceae bacterium]
MINTIAFWLVLFGSATLYWLLPLKLRMGFLTTASFFYLITLDSQSLTVLAPIVFAFFYLSPKTQRNKPYASILLPVLILSILGYLAYFKYVPPLLRSFATNPLSEQLLLPLGVSYFTFKLIHYALEISRGNFKEHTLQHFLLYIFLFPIFIAGPIERFDHFLQNQEKKLNKNSIVEGLQRIIYGLIKKFVLAETLIFRILDKTPPDLLIENTPFDIWVYVVLFFVYAYLDFSSYSDIAIGSARLFGFRIMENFNFPLFAPNISEFWNRWHMSLSGWCRAYVYMPMIGLTRNPYIAVYATMSAIGLWHGGTFSWLFWGIYHAIGITTYGTWLRYRRKKKCLPSQRFLPRFFGIILTIAFVSTSYVFPISDQAGSLMIGFRLLAKMFWLDL